MQNQQNTQQAPTSTERFNYFETMFKRVLSRRAIDHDEINVIETMRLWGVNLTNQATPERLVANLRGDDLPDDPNAQFSCSVGLEWFNPLTDSNVVLTISQGLQMELRDHDGAGDDLTPWFYADGVSDPDTSDESLFLNCIDYFVWYCRDQTTEYNTKLASQEGYISGVEFKATLNDMLKASIS